MDSAKLKKLVSNNVVVVVLILLCIGFGLSNKTFFGGRNVSNILSQMCTNALLASGLTYVIILGGIDISVGSIAGVAGVIVSFIGLRFPDMNVPFAMFLIITTGIVVGALCGLINGVLIAYYTYDLYGINHDGTERSCFYLDRRAAGVRTADLICIPWCKQSYTYTDYA